MVEDDAEAVQAFAQITRCLDEQVPEILDEWNDYVVEVSEGRADLRRVTHRKTILYMWIWSESGKKGIWSGRVSLSKSN